MKKRCFLISFIFILSVNVFAQKSTSFNTALEDFMNFRVNLTCFNDKADCALRLKNYWNNDFFGKYDFNSFAEQEKLVLNNLYLLEEYNYIWEDHSNDSYLISSFEKQIEICEAYIANNSDVIGWLYVTEADMFSCVMSYNPVSGALKYGLKVKEYYENCLKVDPENAYCLAHYAQWFYWAPGVNGGSKTKALKYFEKALESSKNYADIFYSEIFLSQILYENKEFEQSKQHLNHALEMCKTSYYAKEMQQLNEEGFSLFTYSKKKAKDENRVGDKY